MRRLRITSRPVESGDWFYVSIFKFLGQLQVGLFFIRSSVLLLTSSKIIFQIISCFYSMLLFMKAMPINAVYEIVPYIFFYPSSPLCVSYFPFLFPH